MRIDVDATLPYILNSNHDHVVIIASCRILPAHDSTPSTLQTDPATHEFLELFPISRPFLLQCVRTKTPHMIITPQLSILNCVSNDGALRFNDLYHEITHWDARRTYRRLGVVFWFDPDETTFAVCRAIFSEHLPASATIYMKARIPHPPPEAPK